MDLYDNLGNHFNGRSQQLMRKIATALMVLITFLGLAAIWGTYWINLTITEVKYTNRNKKEVIVVGGGLAGLSAAMRLAENGCHVKIVSVTKVKRSHSVCAQGGINAAMNIKGEEDSPIIHAYDTIKGGDFLANQPPVLRNVS